MDNQSRHNTDDSGRLNRRTNHQSRELSDGDRRSYIPLTNAVIETSCVVWTADLLAALLSEHHQRRHSPLVVFDSALNALVTAILIPCYLFRQYFTHQQRMWIAF